jgi:hypothetical protein
MWPWRAPHHRKPTTAPRNAVINSGTARPQAANATSTPTVPALHPKIGRCNYMSCDYCCINNKCGTYEECETWIIAIICVWVAISALIIGLVCYKRNRTMARMNSIYNHAQKAEREALSDNIKKERERTQPQ